MEVGQQQLRDEGWRVGVRELTHAEELHDVGMTQAAHQFALLNKLFAIFSHHFSIDPPPNLPFQNSVHLLDCAHGARYLSLQDFAVRSISEDSARWMGRVDLVRDNFSKRP